MKLLTSKKFSSFIKSPNKTPSLFMLVSLCQDWSYRVEKRFLLRESDIALAMSSDNPTTLLAFMPALGTNSNSVTIGPDLKFTISPSTPYSNRVFLSFRR